ncbi:NAD(P)H-hydrate dehydratase [Formicincola oecophyllae]|uniref:ADP-dependent (S)-NAD(P)H-hydrate dehydratase n=1 Tax=Formicincola oecophyllae TaxID=2558361 RepID=A0A4Y6UCH1_9PROT|nr:NAD(P)H-hydrate dehydratase [Formicincola oecophyllae]
MMDKAAGALLPALMEQAGAGAARLLLERGPELGLGEQARVVVLAGPGNNGGDGYVMARHLATARRDVTVVSAGEPRTELAKAARQAWSGAVIPLASFQPDSLLHAEGIVVDALFGAGFKGDLPSAPAAFLQGFKHRMALDMPSGVDGLSGDCAPGVAPCQLTAAFGRLRPGQLLLPGKAVCGVVKAVPMTMPPESIQAMEDAFPAAILRTPTEPVPAEAEGLLRFFHNAPGLWRLPLQTPLDNKYTRGVVSVIGGGVMSGAGRLSLMGARRSGCGLARVAVQAQSAMIYILGAAGAIIDELTPSVTLQTLLEDKRRHTWVCGPGLTSSEVMASFPVLLAAKRQVVADAGTLDWAAGAPEKLRGAAVITPHAGEFARVFNTPRMLGLLKRNRPLAALEAARLTGAVCVLKGSDSVVAAPDGRVAINTHASDGLATAGSGDVLSGVVGTCLAVGMAPWEAACAAVWLHGQAGQAASAREGGWPLAEDVAAELGRARGLATTLQQAG